tara:strand:+ start:276 stop:539 length:264 start_codon:yes stop_codon:yes gene_type:complete
MKQLNKIKFTDSKNMNVRMLPKRELQKMLKALRDANKQAGKTIFNIFKESMGYSVIIETNKGKSIRVLNALNFNRFYTTRIDKNLFL